MWHEIFTMLLHTSHAQRRRSSLAQIHDLPSLTKQDRPALLRRRSTLTTIDQGVHQPENRPPGAGEVRPTKTMPHPLKRKWSSSEKKPLSRVDSSADLQSSNLVLIGLFVTIVCVAVVGLSLLCRYYFNVWLKYHIVVDFNYNCWINAFYHLATMGEKNI